MRIGAIENGAKVSVRGLAVFLLPLIFFPRLLNGQGTELTLEEAIRMALVNNERALAADARLSAAEARVARARSFFMPSLNASGTYTRRPDEVTRIINDQRLVVQSFNALSGAATLNLTLFAHEHLPKGPGRIGLWPVFPGPLELISPPSPRATRR